MIVISTTKSREILDITPQVRAVVGNSGIKSGICLVYTMHTTTAIIVNEAEDGLLKDIVDKMDEILPRSGYRHGENGPAHVQASLLGSSVVLPVEDSALILGSWQRILFVELDGPRRRRVGVKVIGS